MSIFVEKTSIWWALGIEIMFFRKFENYDLRLKSDIKNQNTLMEMIFWWAPSTVSRVFRKSWFLLKRQMPTVFSIRENGFYKTSKSFLCKSKNLRLRTACIKTHLLISQNTTCTTLSQSHKILKYLVIFMEIGEFSRKW